MENILLKILNKKKEKIKFYKKTYNENEILENIKSIKNFINFKEKIEERTSKKKLSIIAEIKKASPSAGEIVKNFDHLKIATTYVKNGASCLSVLTEEDFFLGQLDYIKNIKNNHKIPILCKDFFIDTYQVSLARSFGADCILIILSAVDVILAKDLYQAANDLNMSSIIEVHSKIEAEKALSFGKSLIGINNRDLKTLETKLDTTVKLYEILKDHPVPLISESGFHLPKNIKYIFERTKICNYLIGESLLSSDDIGSKLREINQITL